MSHKTSKTYEDGSVVANSSDADCLPLRTTWARGAWRDREYDAMRRESGIHYSDPSLDCAFARDVFGALVGASNAVAQAAILRDNPGMATNETHAINPTCEVVRDNASGTVTDVYDYYWGKDISGSLQGAGGIGGLLAVVRDGATYLPCYDANGNVTEYVSESGTVVAAYVYDAFGNTLSATGSMADAFSYRFSTKYWDGETGLYYYGYRFYSPEMGRWMNRDPIGEEGGVNLLMAAENSAINCIDILGLRRWIILYYAKPDQPKFQIAAETLKHDIESSEDFEETCDKVLIEGVLTVDDFENAWNRVRTATNGIDPNLQVLRVHIITHSGEEGLYIGNKTFTNTRIVELPQLNWARSGMLIAHGCNSGLPDTHGNSVARSFMLSQFVVTLGTDGYSSFSANPAQRLWTVSTPTTRCYLWSFGSGVPKFSFGIARSPVTFVPPGVFFNPPRLPPNANESHYY